uniref:YABBY transcription factor n=1 Tax=Ephedra distachya TaxID=3389 RepID=A0A140KQD3_EPHDI|nr:YABBY transcription factor [Ephedra distachya]
MGIAPPAPAPASSSATSTTTTLPYDDQHLVCVRCKYCTTVLAVHVPRSSMMKIVPVTCGHCTNLLSVDMSGVFHHLKQIQALKMQNEMNLSCSSSSRIMREGSDNKKVAKEFAEKRQGVPSAYNQFIREEIQRIKASNPAITHKEAFSAAAKNWAHLGLMLSDNNKRQTSSS